MMVRFAWILLAVACPLASCGSDSDSDSAGLGGKCLSDQDICQFVKGVSTKEDVRSKLGNAQQYVNSESAIYVCQRISGQQIVHNDLVTFSFDADGLLTDILVIRQGSGATPPPSCAE